MSTGNILRPACGKTPCSMNASEPGFEAACRPYAGYQSRVANRAGHVTRSLLGMESLASIRDLNRKLGSHARNAYVVPAAPIWVNVWLGQQRPLRAVRPPHALQFTSPQPNAITPVERAERRGRPRSRLRRSKYDPMDAFRRELMAEQDDFTRKRRVTGRSSCC